MNPILFRNVILVNFRARYLLLNGLCHLSSEMVVFTLVVPGILLVVFAVFANLKDENWGAGKGLRLRFLR